MTERVNDLTREETGWTYDLIFVGLTLLNPTPFSFKLIITPAALDLNDVISEGIVTKWSQLLIHLPTFPANAVNILVFASSSVGKGE